MQEIFNYSNRLINGVSLGFTRYLFSEINWNARLIEIIGARGVGKTTLMLQKASLLNKEKPNQAVYISLDDQLMYSYSIVDIAEILEQYGVKYLFLDEVHKYPSKHKGYDWSAEIKNSYDRFPGLKIIFSGSSVLKIYKGHGDLSRRKSTYNLVGFSFREYLAFNEQGNFKKIGFEDLLYNHQDITSEITKKKKILPLFKAYLKTGYYPFYYEDPEFYFDKLNAILNVIIETDIPAISDISFETAFKIKKLLSAIASTVPYVPNLVKLRDELHISDQRTLLKYLDYLEKAEVIMSLSQKATGNKIMQKPDKILLGNPNLYYSFIGVNVKSGSIRETFFSSQVSVPHGLKLPPTKGDFLVDNQFLFEVGGKNKSIKQIRNEANAYIVLDDIENGIFNHIPLWLFGFLY